MLRINCSDGSKLEATEDEFAQFRNGLVVQLDDRLEQRISHLVWMDMFVGYKRSSLNCFAVLGAIKNLEAGEPESGVKPATRFRREPLKGLWHKHFYTGANLPLNVINGLRDGELERIAEKLRNEGHQSEDLDRRRYLGAAMQAVKNSLAERSSAQKLTGEWLIFAKCNTGNLYLSLGYHDQGCSSEERDHFLFERIKSHCAHEFPDLHMFIQNG
ncbi:Hypothetical protein RG1141_CH29470 [Neorhizobium galegae bv. officinalis bv. officinalis str. HAMBI 1141]|uniref:Uncharacterized protein n=1 Tax=Neorhizobium galegae bv. officinalis bv. officinalis str. HAMBI 1141 TaxID=1028801 RepID=A0A068T9Z8_NEOGA|nr:hypothetical protein [Neorhizobium galegae]CDN55283.1 Hypothetical protein RG1141_CH29470 [Neorhizobium galegae bv. officinalis bv. officinalis str. HAMBI 1141]